MIWRYYAWCPIEINYRIIKEYIHMASPLFINCYTFSCWNLCFVFLVLMALTRKRCTDFEIKKCVRPLEEFAERSGTIFPNYNDQELERYCVYVWLQLLLFFCAGRYVILKQSLVDFVGEGHWYVFHINHFRTTIFSHIFRSSLQNYFLSLLFSLNMITPSK